MNTCPPLTIAIQSRVLLCRVTQVLSEVYTPKVLKFLDNFELFSTEKRPYFEMLTGA